MENQYRLGLLRMERAIRERMSSVDIDTVMPQDLINAKPAECGCGASFSARPNSASSWTRQNPLGPRLPHKRRLSALGPGGLTRERARLRSPRRAPDALRAGFCPIENARGTEYRPYQFARDLRAG